MLVKVSFEYRVLRVDRTRYPNLIAITLNDPRERELPDRGLIEIEDAETGERTIADTGAPDVRADYARRADQRLAARERLFRSMGVDHIDVSTDVPYVDKLIQFFAARRKRLR